MGFGKFLLGGVCAVGAVIAAPIVVPVATGALLTGATGTVGLAAGEALLFASSTSVAAGAAAVGGTAGLAAGAIQEKKERKSYEEGRTAGMRAASNSFQSKFEDLEKRIKEMQEKGIKDKQEYAHLFNEMAEYIRKLEEENEKLRKDAVPNEEDIKHNEMMISMCRLKMFEIERECV